MRVIPVVVKIAAPGLTKIPVSDQVGFLSSRFTARSDRRSRLFQKIDAGASGLIVTMTMGPKPTGLPVLQGSALSPTEVQFVGSLGQLPNVKSRTGRPVKRRVTKTVASVRGTTYMSRCFGFAPADLASRRLIVWSENWQ
jgi:hypothetical protein